MIAAPHPSLQVMKSGDLDAVLDNEAAAYRFPWTRQNFVDCIRARHECWVMDVDLKVVGHGLVSVAAGESHLLNVCVHPSYQGCGFGRQFTRFLVERARQREAQVMFLEVRPSNGVAIALYDSLGFREIGRRRDYYRAEANRREDAVVMALELEQDRVEALDASS